MCQQKWLDQNAFEQNTYENLLNFEHVQTFNQELHTRIYGNEYTMARGLNNFLPISKYLPMVLYVTEYDIIKLYSQFKQQNTSAIRKNIISVSKDARKSFLW